MNASSASSSPAREPLASSATPPPPFALRFEGHHLSVNVRVVEEEDKKEENGGGQGGGGGGNENVRCTPLFLGAVPMVAPPAPAGASAANDTSNTEWWEAGRGTVHYNSSTR